MTTTPGHTSTPHRARRRSASAGERRAHPRPATAAAPTAIASTSDARTSRPVPLQATNASHDPSK
jgi:hypothetical protein